MTTSPATPVTTYELSGTAAGPFATSWPYATPTEVVALIQTGGVDGAPLTQGVAYTLTATDPLINGGTVTLAAGHVPVGGWPAASRLVLRRQTPRQQVVALPDTQGHRPKATEGALDRAMRIAQEQDEVAARAIRAPTGETGLTLPPAAQRADRLAGFDGDGRLVGSARTLTEFDDDLAAAETARDQAEAAAAEAANRADRTLSNLSNRRTARLNLNQFWATPEDFGAVGDGVTDDTAAIAAMVASPLGRNVRWGDGKTYMVSSTIIVTQANTTWEGAATIKLVRPPSTPWVVPLVVVRPSATRFFGADTLTYDHNAASMPQPTLAVQLAFAYCCAMIVEAQGSIVGGRFLNSWDNGLAIGNFEVTGDGSAGSPFMATQQLAQPQGWVVTTVWAENCGCGVHVPFTETAGPTTGRYVDENGRKGAVVNILNAGDGVVQSVGGRNNYNGFIVDFGGGAEVSVGSLAFTNTIMDLITNGSGIDCYIGSGPVIIGSFKSDNAGRMGLAISPEAQEVVINARIHAPGYQGAVIEGGKVSGTISVSASGLANPGAHDAIEVRAGAAGAELNLLAHVTPPIGTPAAHRYAYKSSQSGGGAVSGGVELVASAGTLGLVDIGGSEAVRIARRGAYGVGMAPVTAASTSKLFLGGDLSLLGGASTLLGNLYYDTETPSWRFLGDGWGWLLKSEGDGTVGLYVSTASNGAGAGAPAAVQRISTFRSDGADLPRARFFAPGGTGVVGDTNYRGAVEVIAAGTSKRLALVYDNASDRAVIQAVEPGVTVKPLALNPGGGAVSVGNRAALATSGSLAVQSRLAVGASASPGLDGCIHAELEFRVGANAGTRVLSGRRTGWSTPTGTATRTAFDTATVTTWQLAERVKALIDDLHATAGHGLIGS